MVSLPAEVLVGIYLGLLVGTIPGLASWALGFGFERVSGLTIPGVAVVGLALALAGVNGFLLALAGESVIGNAGVTRTVTASLVVGILALYAHSTGETMARNVQSSVSNPRRQRRSADSGTGDGGDGDELRIRVVGDVADMSGHPPLSEAVREELRSAEVTLPADLGRDELETRTENRLRTEYDLGAVSVSIDDRGRATVTAAPSFSGLSKSVESGRHAVSVTGLIPTGLARGDEVTVITPDVQVRGTVLSAQTTERDDTQAESDSTPVTSKKDDDGPAPARAPTTDGGEGRLTVAVTRTDVQPLLRAPEAKIVVESRGTRREFEVVSMLRRADRRFRRLVVGAGSRLDGLKLGTADLRSTEGVDIFAIKRGDTWQVAPDGTTTLEAGDELFAVGERDRLESFGGQTP